MPNPFRLVYVLYRKIHGEPWYPLIGDVLEITDRAVKVSYYGRILFIPRIHVRYCDSRHVFEVKESIAKAARILG
jgi:hypothetical protein